MIFGAETAGRWVDIYIIPFNLLFVMLLHKKDGRLLQPVASWRLKFHAGITEM